MMTNPISLFRKSNTNIPDFVGFADLNLSSDPSILLPGAEQLIDKKKSLEKKLRIEIMQTEESRPAADRTAVPASGKITRGHAPLLLSSPFNPVRGEKN
jgi:hypothetical protein